MTTIDLTEHTPTVDELVLRRVDIDDQIKRLQDEKDAINATLIDELGLGTHNHAHAKIVISRRGMLDTKKLETAFPAEQYPQLYAPKLDTTAVKEQFAPAALESYKTYSAPSVSIRA